MKRNEFPYDLKHKINEEKFGPPGGEEKLLYYDLDRHKFFKTQRPKPAPAPEAPEEETSMQLESETTESEIMSPVEPPLEEEPGSLPPLKPQPFSPDFFIDLNPLGGTQPMQPLPEKGTLDYDTP